MIEEVEFEALLGASWDRVIAKNPDLAAARGLEQSPANVILEPVAYGQMILRQRINAAARSSMLAFATGSDLDNLAAFFNMNRGFDVVRAALVETPRNVDDFPDDWEANDRFRRRIQLAPEAYATCGSEGGFIYHALSAVPSLRDVSAVRVDDRGLVRVTLMNSGADPTPTKAQIDAVSARLNDRRIKALTDTVYVAPVEVIRTRVTGSLTLYPGPDASIVLRDAQAALVRLRDRLSLLGRDLTLSALITACNQEGVLNVTIDAPVADITVTPSQCVLIESVNLAVLPFRQE